MSKQTQTKSPKSKTKDADQILDAALEMAREQDNWYDLSFIELADHSGTSINDIRRHYSDTNDIANAWFTRAMDHMLSSEDESISDLPVKTRLEYFIWRWFESLAPYHRVTAQMLGSKLHPPHIHHWVPMIFDLSKLVQLWRDVSGLRAGGRQRQIEEIVLTGIFLTTLATWCRDDTAQQTKAHSRLLGLLDKADRSAQKLFSDSSS